SWFFFSTRRRHTRWPRDWSSDVCSSDLFAKGAGAVFVLLPIPMLAGLGVWLVLLCATRYMSFASLVAVVVLGAVHLSLASWNWKIGRASCRERVEVSGGGVS